ncbi:ComEC/Rec2 family competence protein [Rufibacter latericius]|uniref:ComEC family competence protein n=1 Tax=Rufibacter latericius TaxID=2487040 RepID=A0A3M9MAN4_9BACT|nr:ComEC/Rec2 family competence protein [Rufibacter latericius]RNI22640.1 ComEC family competence protein [Rufibacter latericius]
MAKTSLAGSFRLLGSFIAGIILYHFIGRDFSFAGEATAFFVVLFLGLGWFALKRPLVRYRRLAGLAGMLAVAAFAFWGTSVKNRPQTLLVPSQEITHYRITLVKAVALKPKTVSSVGRVEAVLSGGKWYPANGQVAVFLPRSQSADSFHYGQQLLVQGSLTPPSKPANPFQFDYRRYLALKHIQWQAYLPEGTWLVLGIDPPSSVVALSLKIRKQLENAFGQHIRSKRELTIAHALVLGVQDDLDASLRNAYARTGTMHVLAVSGLHVGLLYGVLLFFLKPLRRGKTSKVFIFLLVIGVVWFYAFVTGLSASVLRSVCMFSLVELGLLLRRKSSILNTLAVVALGLLLYEPNFLFDVGFQLSFLAVAGIVLLQPLSLKLWYPERKPVRLVWELLAISIAAQLATFPLSLYYFHQFPVYFWVANLVAVPLTSLGLYIGVAFMMLFWVPMVNTVLSWLLEKALWVLNEVLLWLEHWPKAVLEGFVITPGQIIALYLLIFAVVLFLVQKKLQWLRVGVLCLAFISGTELAEAHRQRRSRELVIHSARRSSVVSVLQGRQVAFLADSSFFAQPQLFSYQVQPYWWAKGVRQETPFRPDFLKTGSKQLHSYETPEGNRLVVWHGKRLLWLRKMPKALESPLALDAVVLQHNVWSPVERLQTFCTARFVLLDQTNARRYTTRKAAELRAAGYRVHVLEEQGALRLVKQ